METVWRMAFGITYIVFLINLVVVVTLTVLTLTEDVGQHLYNFTLQALITFTPMFFSGIMVFVYDRKAEVALEKLRDGWK